MNGLTFETSGNKTFLVYKVQEKDQIDTVGVGMLTNNKISGIAPVIYTQMNEEIFFKYDVSSKITAKDFFSKQLDRKRIIGVFSSIGNALLDAEDYMISIFNFVFKSELIYIDENTLEVSLVCLPITNYSSSEDEIIDFFKTTVYGLQINKEENCNYFAQLFNYFNNLTAFSVFDYTEFLKTINQETFTNTKPAEKQEKKSISPIVGNTSQEHKTSLPQNINPITPVNKPVQVPKETKVKAEEKETSDKSQNNKKMSVFWLLQHYNEDNLKLYKEQKNSNKTNKEKPSKVKESSKSKKTSDGVNLGIPVPGMPVPGFDNAKEQVHKEPKPVKEKMPQIDKKEPKSTKKESKEVVISPPVVPTGLGVQATDETTVLNLGSAETTILTAVSLKPEPYLVRLKNGEKVLVDKPRFRIGKEKSYVDYFIGDNTAISRSHADIIVKGDSYFLVDLNSTNHTFVNGAMLQGNAEVQIKNGNRIRLANEDFDFIEEI